MKTLGELLTGTPILRTGGDSDILALDVQPRQIAEGKVFFKLRGLSAADAIRRGARYVLLQAGDEEEALLPPGLSYAIVDDVNRAFARTCSRMFGDAHRQLRLIGVTGAKGKTTVCHLIDGALRASGVRSGLISSLVVRFPQSERAVTTAMSDTLSIYSFLAALRQQGATHAVLELTSLAIAEERLFGLQFDTLVFTGGGGDAHTPANRRLFTDPELHKSANTLCVFNSDDPAGRELAAASLGRVVTFGFGAADVTPESYSSDRTGISMRVKGHDLRLPLIGRHNAMNVLAAAAVVPEEAIPQLQNAGSLPGRLERLRTPLDVDVYLDQAYAPPNIEVSLAAVREFAGSRRIVCVIGCMGGSDRAQRPLRARAAMDGADFCILTSEDTQSEHPSSIVMDMLKGLRHASPDRMKTIIDRRTAIDAAIREALPDGIVVVIGKRVMGAELRNWDRQVAEDALHEIGRRSKTPPASGHQTVN